VVIASQQDPTFEILARGIAYKNWSQGDTIGYGNYVVDAVVDGASFYAICLARSEASGSPTRDPIFVFRGTDNPVDAFSNTIAEGVGYDQFQGNQYVMRTWVDKWTNLHETVDLVGHSLGGALAQWFAAEWTSLGYSLGDIATYNSPGISDAYAEKFLPARCHSVVHNIVNGDLVSMAGQAFIAGENVRNILYSYSEPKVWLKHSRPLQTDQINGLMRPADLKSQEIPSHN
jgi:hypothetical protein